MIKVDNKVIYVPVEDILLDFQKYMLHRGVSVFGYIKRTGNNIMIKCPVHKHGQERKPSCGVLAEDNGGTPAGTAHCFTCGYTAPLPKLLSYVLGDYDSDSAGKRWLLDTYIDNVDTIRPQIDLPFDVKETNEPTTFVSEEELDSYRYFHPYMYKRKLTNKVIEEFDIGYDRDARCITMPVCDKDGNCVFVARRSVTGKFFNYPSGVNKPVYGLDKLLRTDARSVIVCESVFNCLSCYVYGNIPAVALLGTGTQDQYAQLDDIGIREFILGFDPDSAGIHARERFYNYFKSKAFISYLDIPEGKDINDLTQDEFLALKRIPMNY